VGPLTFAGQRYYARLPTSEFASIADRAGAELRRPGLDHRRRARLERRARLGRDRYPGEKLLLLVAAGERVTLAAPTDQRRRVSLLYGSEGGAVFPPRRGRPGFAVSDGAAAVTLAACRRRRSLREAREECGPRPFRACRWRNTQFNGGLIVAGARCVELEVWVDGRPEPLRAQLPFGRRC
jgi:hypothetical protein